MALNDELKTLTTSQGRWRGVILIGIIVVLIVGALFTCNRTRSGVSPQSQHTLDSLAATQPTHDSARASTLTSEHAGAVTSTRQGATVIRYVAVASREHVIADSLARVAIAQKDTAISAWQEAYASRTREADTLRVALDTARAQVLTERFRVSDADRRAALDSARLGAVVRLNAGLVNDANRAANCRVLGFIPCATRGQTFVGGAVVAIIATKLIEAELARRR